MANKYIPYYLDIKEIQQTATITPTEEAQIVPLDSGKVAVKEVTVNPIPDEYMRAKLNIHYGDTAPEDTSMLYIQEDEPTALLISNDELEPTSAKCSATLTKSAYSTVVGAVGKTAYILGGCNNNNPSAKVQMFDMESKTISDHDTWYQSNKGNSGVAVVDDKIIVIGGGHGSAYSNTILIYDTTNNISTTSNCKLPIACEGVGVGVVDGLVYIFGGWAGSNTKALSTCYVYNPSADTLTTLDVSLPEARGLMGSFTIGKKIYLVGGIDNSTVDQKTMYVFDTVTKTFDSNIVNMTYTCRTNSWYVRNNIPYRFGGYYGSKSNNVYALDVNTGSLTLLPTSTYLSFGSADIASYGDTVYIFGSTSISGGVTIQEYTFNNALTNKNVFIKVSETSNFVNLCEVGTASVRLGIDSVYIGNANMVKTVSSAFLYDDANSIWKGFNGEQYNPLIRFTLDGVEKKAFEGVTWAEWCESKYNGDYTVDSDGYISYSYTEFDFDMGCDYEYTYYITQDSAKVKSTDIITRGVAYKTDEEVVQL